MPTSPDEPLRTDPNRRVPRAPRPGEARQGAREAGSAEPPRTHRKQQPLGDLDPVTPPPESDALHTQELPEERAAEDAFREEVRKRRIRKRYVFIGSIVVGVAICLFLAWEAREYAVQQAEIRRLETEARAEFDVYLSDIRENIREVQPLTSAERSQLRRSLNATHIANGERYGIPALQSRDDLDGLQDRLVRIDDTPYYHVLPANYSVPYLTPGAAALLDTIGARFHQRLAAAGLPLFQYGITSALRSAEDQRALTGSNVNAARGVSSHQFATTFDISNRRYRYGGTLSQDPPPLPPGLPEGAAEDLREERDQRLNEELGTLAQRYNERLQALLGRTMIELENEGALVVVLERRQPVYHTTVSTNLVP
jgi:hypothetical protein